MSNYIPNYQKHNKIVIKRERELVHAIRNNYSEEKLYRAAEKLRASKIQAITINLFPSNLSLDERIVKRDLLIHKWDEHSVEEIMAMYKKSVM